MSSFRMCQPFDIILVLKRCYRVSMSFFFPALSKYLSFTIGRLASYWTPKDLFNRARDNLLVYFQCVFSNCFSLNSILNNHLIVHSFIQGSWSKVPTLPFTWTQLVVSISTFTWTQLVVNISSPFLFWRLTFLYFVRFEWSFHEKQISRTCIESFLMSVPIVTRAAVIF